MAQSPDLRVLSLGAGVQSTALYLMALLDYFDQRPDFAVFADTQQEPPWVYETLWQLAAHGGDRIPIIVATAGDIGDAVIAKTGHGSGGRFASVPFWVQNDDGSKGIGRRQCTREYKIDAIKQVIRRALGVAPGKHATKYRVEQWIGISLDEATRAKPSRDKWLVNRWPLLLDHPMRRYQLEAWLQENWPHPVKKSSCVMCPFRQDLEYARWRENHPDLFEEACKWDEASRDATAAGPKGAQYVSRSLVPLRLLPTVKELEYTPQLNLFENECEGMCGV